MKTPDETFQRLIRCCDTVKIHSDSYFKGCYLRRNRYLVDQSQRVIAVYNGNGPHRRQQPQCGMPREKMCGVVWD